MYSMQVHLKYLIKLPENIYVIMHYSLAFEKVQDVWHTLNTMQNMQHMGDTPKYNHDIENLLHRVVHTQHICNME